MSGTMYTLPTERTSAPFVVETGIELNPDRTRVIARLFVPGREDVGPGDSRAVPVIERILALDEREVDLAVIDIHKRFAHRHRDLDASLREHAAMVSTRIDDTAGLSPARVLLLGASFTHEYAIEGAALCNPSAVLDPHQDNRDGTSFIVSVRGIGEGHKSSIGFRTGRISAAGRVTIDQTGPFARAGKAGPGRHHKSVFHAKLAELNDDRENVAFVLDPLPDEFGDRELDGRLKSLAADTLTRPLTATTIKSLRAVAESSYSIGFPADTGLSERVLWPHSAAEHQGMEDARFVRFTGADGTVTYFGTYTAFDGTRIAQHLLETNDFTSFAVSPMAGNAAIGKGLALFPRKINGRYAALSRSDRETNSIAYSDDVHCWSDPRPIQLPTRLWEILQLGNCGSPIETEAGWLVLTHGVGPMRTYSLGAILLDLDDPSRVVAHTDAPIIWPDNDTRRDGYVPNVVYSCGSFAHGDTLVLPYGIGDQTIAIATLSINELLGGMTGTPSTPSRGTRLKNDQKRNMHS
jgi:predicted GH43/DUF377 family glycosyl hydrolase